MAPIQWFYKINGEEHGPVTSADLRNLAADGILKSTDLVRKEEMDEWLTADRLKGLEFVDASYDPYDEEYDPNEEEYGEHEYATGRADGRSHRGPVVYAGFWLRFCAMFVDGLILLVPQLVLGFAIGIGFIAVMGPNEAENNPLVGLTAQFAGIISTWLYCALMESSSTQGTLGKMLLGIKVTDINGKRLTFGRASGRHFAKILSHVILLIGFIMAGFTEKKQALHDMLASTLVVRK